MLATARPSFLLYYDEKMILTDIEAVHKFPNSTQFLSIDAKI